MILRSRLLRYALLALAILLAAGYSAFATFLFNPLESDLDADVAALVPRDVDFFAAKARLSDAFDPFPRLAVLPRLEKNTAWRAWTGSPECADLARELRVAETLKELEDAARQIPLGMEPQEVFGGRDLALAGWFRGAELAQAEWAAYGRANWAGKLVAALLKHPKLAGLEKQGLTAKTEGEVVELSGPKLPRPVYVTRIRDVVIVSTAPGLPKRAHELQAQGFQDSLHQSAAYDDHIRSAWRNAAKDEFEVYVNARKLIENLKIPAPWPNPKSQDFGPALLGRLFQIRSLKNAMGVIGLDQGIQADLHGDLSSEQVAADQERVYRTRGFDRNLLLGEAARLAPRDTSLLVYLHAPIGDFLRMILGSVEPALRANLEDAFRNTGKYPTLDKLVTDLDGALKDRVCVIVRPNDYPPDPEGPPHDQTPVPAVAVVVWTKNVEAINDLRELIGRQGAKFGLAGKTPNEPGFFKNYEAGYETREYWSALVPGTGIVVTANAGEMTVVTNSLGMMGHIIKTYTQGTEKYPRLSEEPRFQALVQSALPRANAMVWWNPRTAASILRAGAERAAEDSVRIDQRTERARIETKLSRERFGGRPPESLSAEEKTGFEAAVDEEMDALRKRIKEQQIPARMAEQERWISMTEGVAAALVMLALDPKSFDLSVRVMAPVEGR